jgi:release factor glutamine methyltransferase
MKKNEVYKYWRELKINSNKIEIILLKITELSKSQLFLLDEINDEYFKEIKNIFYRLSNWEPLEYIINNAEFYSLNFYVNSKVLIPRDDTEILVDKVLDTIVNYNSLTLIDIWTWSSCIPISIIKNTTKVGNCYVIDISKNALKVIEKNIYQHNLEKKIKQINWDLIQNLISSNNYNFKKNIIITANLPYIKNNDFENIDKETIKYEPALALYWWKDTWFELYEQLIKESSQFKNIYNLESLILFIEIWFDQKEYSEKYLSKLNLKYKIFKDNNWIDRCIKIEF